MSKLPPPMPWRAFGETQPDGDYLVLLTHLPVRRPTALPTFLRHVWRIRGQLEAAPTGLAGYSLFAQPFSSNYWTLSAWESSAAMGAFMRASPHREAMVELPKVLSEFRTWRWTSTGRALPPSWDDALAHV